jgi:ActR/RegA family two-component response regulator
MPDAGEKATASVLIVSEDTVAIGRLTEAMQHLSLSVHAFRNISAAASQLKHRKFEAVVVDLSLERAAGDFLKHLRASASNQTAVTFAITAGGDEIASALSLGFRFALQRPLTPDSISRTLQIAYGLIMRERRRYFRYPIAVPAVFKQKGSPEVYGRTVNISERGLEISTTGLLPRGCQGTVQFALPRTNLQITAESKVCWNNERGHAGLSFLFLPVHIASELQAWLAQKLDAALPKPIVQEIR